MDTNKREKENRRTADARGFTQIKTEVQNSRENAQKDVKKRSLVKPRLVRRSQRGDGAKSEEAKYL
jgi:hypothetical protein